MTGTEGQVPPGDPTQLPLTLELLADLHAGVFDEQVAAPLRRRVAADSQARAVLAALDATVADLSTLPRPPRLTRMPDAVADRLDAAVAAEARRAAPPGPSAAQSLRRSGWAGIAVLAAAAAATGVVALMGLPLETAGVPRAALGGPADVEPTEPLALTRANLGGALEQALQARDYGPLSPPALLRRCLATHGVSPGGKPLGALEVTLNGEPGVLLVLPTGQIAQVRLLVVSPQCNPDNPAPLAEYLVGR